MPNKLKELVENGVLSPEEVLENIFSNYFSIDEANDCVDWIYDEYSIDLDEYDDVIDEEEVDDE